MFSNDAADHGLCSVYGCHDYDLDLDLALDVTLEDGAMMVWSRAYSLSRCCSPAAASECLGGPGEGPRESPAISEAQGDGQQ